MNTKTAALIFSIFIVSLIFIQGKNPDKTNRHITTDSIEFTADVKAIIDQKCYGCHNLNSKNEKAKHKLKWDSLTLIPKAKQIAKLDKIIEVLEKESMPPEKFLAYKPEGKLTEDEIKKLKEWADANAERLLK